MNLDDRLHRARGWLSDATAQSTPDLADLDRRRRRHDLGRAAAASLVIVVAIVAATIGYAATRNDSTIPVAAGAASQADPPPPSAAGAASQPDLPPAPAERVPSDNPAYVLTELPSGWQEATPTSGGVDHSQALLGEEFSQVYARFETEQNALSAHEGNLVSAIRVAVGTYDDGLRDLFTGPSTRVTVSGRAFDLVETGADQVVLVPVDVSERTFLLAARGVDPNVVVAMAEPIDPTQPIPRVGDAPDGFTVIYSGAPEFAVLTDGTAVSYRSQTGEQTFTVTTFSDVAISCFSNAWAYANTEITRIGGDAGVVAQLAGQPGAVGTYRALWNRGDRTLIGITASGIDRTQLIDLADQLRLDNDASGFEAHLELGF